MDQDMKDFGKMESSMAMDEWYIFEVMSILDNGRIVKLMDMESTHMRKMVWHMKACGWMICKMVLAKKYGMMVQYMKVCGNKAKRKEKENSSNQTMVFTKETFIKMIYMEKASFPWMMVDCMKVNG